jgi:oligopeptide/dipeptide ABC transporter ATP-binding protein
LPPRFVSDIGRTAVSHCPLNANINLPICQGWANIGWDLWGENYLSRRSTGSLLQVRGLTVRYTSADGNDISAVTGASFEIGSGETVGLLGESGCGKTTLALALLRLLPPSGRIVTGSVLFHGRAILGLCENELQSLRGADISIVFQEPQIALNPVMRVGEQIAEVIRAHRPWRPRRCREEAQAVLDKLHFLDPSRIYSAYPHQLSGGECQRAVIAQAIACGPALVIADEPVTALDPTVQADVLGVLKDLRARLQIAFLIISHNPAVLAATVDRVLVMYAGRVIEEAAADHIFRFPLHPYTRDLLRCLPEFPARLDPGKPRPLPSIPGSPPDLGHLARGCAFEPRCPDKMEICRTREPEEVQPERTQRVRCFKYGG